MIFRKTLPLNHFRVFRSPGRNLRSQCIFEPCSSSFVPGGPRICPRGWNGRWGKGYNVLKRSEPSLVESSCSLGLVWVVFGPVLVGVVFTLFLQIGSGVCHQVGLVFPVWLYVAVFCTAAHALVQSYFERGIDWNFDCGCFWLLGAGAAKKLAGSSAHREDKKHKEIVLQLLFFTVVTP